MTNKTIAKNIVEDFKQLHGRDGYSLEAYAILEDEIAEALREQAAQTTMPSEAQFKEAFIKAMGVKYLTHDAEWTYRWIKANTKPKERHEASDEEIEKEYDNYRSNNYSNSRIEVWVAGYRAALERMKESAL